MNKIIFFALAFLLPFKTNANYEKYQTITTNDAILIQNKKTQEQNFATYFNGFLLGLQTTATNRFSSGEIVNIFEIKQEDIEDLLKCFVIDYPLINKLIEMETYSNDLLDNDKYQDVFYNTYERKTKECLAEKLLQKGYSMDVLYKSRHQITVEQILDPLGIREESQEIQVETKPIYPIDN